MDVSSVVHARRVSRELLFSLRDFFFPPLCFSCSRLLAENERRVCRECWESMRRVGRDDFTAAVLRQRFTENGWIDGFHSCFFFEHEGVFQRLVHELKYDGMTVLGEELGREVGRAILREGIAHFDAVVPVPLHPAKRRERGYNQSDYVAEGIKAVLRAPVMATLVRRKKNTVSQTHLNAEERERNVGEAFEVNPKWRVLVKGGSFLVVDDVITTGSTIQATARVLKEGGAARVVAASAGLALLSAG